MHGDGDETFSVERFRPIFAATLAVRENDDASLGWKRAHAIGHVLVVFVVSRAESALRDSLVRRQFAVRRAFADENLFDARFILI